MTDNQIIDLFWNRNEDAIAATDAAYGRKLRGYRAGFSKIWRMRKRS